MPNPIDSIDVESRPVKWIFDELRSGNIIIDNSFQRRYVWLKKDKISLIETILLGFPIPEIYLWQNATDPNTGATIYSVVDGQQRLDALLTYISGDITLTPFGLEFKEAAYAGKTFSQLDTGLKSDIWKYKFSVRFIKENVTKEEIVKIFLRLNSTNVVLNPQELRNAEFNGEFIKLAERIAESSFWSRFSVFNSGDLRRMQDIQFISTLLLFLRKGIEEETTQQALNKVYDQYNENYPEKDMDYSEFLAITEIVERLATDNLFTKEILKKKTHFYIIFVLAYYILKLENVNLPELSDKLNEWFQHYLNETNFGEDQMSSLMEEYRELSREGVQKKSNRQRRFDILKEYVGFNG